MVRRKILSEIEMGEFDYMNFNDSGIELVIESGREKYREDFFDLVTEWELYED